MSDVSTRPLTLLADKVGAPKPALLDACLVGTSDTVLTEVGRTIRDAAGVEPEVAQGRGRRDEGR